MSRLSPRTLAVAFGQDLSLFVAWSVIPVWAHEVAHATPAQLGFLPVVGEYFRARDRLAGREKAAPPAG